jgi:phenylpropionate dioxygenase-like ring-hydroxylating dioxygenase large terminal subunit
MKEIDTGGSDIDWKIYQSIKVIEDDIKKTSYTLPIFLSHVNDLEIGFKKPLPQLDNTKFLSRSETGYKIGNNICPHQGSAIIDSISENLSCRFHGWSWDDSGNPVKGNTTVSCQNSSKIILKDTIISNSLVFSSYVNLNDVGVDFSYMKLVEQRVDLVRSNFKNIIDVFLDVDHIPVVHKNVYDNIGISNNVNVSWEYFDWGSIQKVNRTKNNSLEFHNTLLNINDEKLSAIWITIYPYTMIEWQPGALFITVCIPDNAETRVLVLKYRDQRYNDVNWNINNSTWETAWEQDKHQAEIIIKPLEYHTNLEESKLKFRDYLKKIS